MAAPDPPQALTTRLAVRAARLTYRASAAALPTRMDLPRLLDAKELNGRGAEIGVFRAEFSEHLLENWHGRELVSIDPWSAFAQDAYRDVLNAEQEAQDARHSEAAERLRRFGDRSTIWRMTGNEGAARIPDGSLDFVYVDAMHDRENVTSDLRTWLPKLRPGAVFAGHDYLDGWRGPTEFGVRTAVDDFFGKLGLAVRSTFLDEPFLTWVVEIPDPDRRSALAPLGVATRRALVAARRVTP